MIANLACDIEIDDGLEKGQVLPLERPFFLEQLEILQVRRALRAACYPHVREDLDGSGHAVASPLDNDIGYSALAARPVRERSRFITLAPTFLRDGADPGRLVHFDRQMRCSVTRRNYMIGNGEAATCKKIIEIMDRERLSS